jgi:hypothetical protein
LLVALCLLTSVATAYAECAWVLWSHSVPLSQVEKWKPEMGFADAPSCQQMMSVSPERPTIEPGGPEVARTTVDRNTVTVYYKDGRKASASLHCLPDTVDPRGPKPK